MPADALHRLPARPAGRRALSARQRHRRRAAEGNDRAAGREGRGAPQGPWIAILSFGTTLAMALAAGEELNATVVNMRFVKPLDADLLRQLGATHALLVTVEENVVQGGAGSAVNELLAAEGIVIRIMNYGLPDRLIHHGSQDDMRRDARLTREDLLEFIRSHQQNAAPQLTLHRA